MLRSRLTQKNTAAGFTLVETLISVAIFSMIFFAVYTTYQKIFELISLSRERAAAMAFAAEKIELVRNISYGDVGTPNGIPKGVIEPFIEETRNNLTFQLTTVIRNIDDPFDGLIGGTPNDISPADYKLVDMTIVCLQCRDLTPFSVTTFVAPKNLEISSTTNGALFIDVSDGSGQPVIGASVHVENSSTSPAIVIDDVTGTNGVLQLVDIPPGFETYEVTVTKDGYTTDQTMLRGEPSNPNPTKPHATVAAETVTALTMSIDQISMMNFHSITESCVPIPNLDFHLEGSKVIGTSPTVKKYDADVVTDGSGNKTVTNLDWDTYDLSLTDAVYELIGTNALAPIDLLPGEAKDVDLIVAPQNPRTLLVTVKDGATDLPISGADVTLSAGAYSESAITGRGYLTQTDWSGGAGQATTTDVTKYWSSDGNMEISTPAGEVKLRDNFGTYVPFGQLESSSFDTGSASNFHEITFLPLTQNPAVGDDSVLLQFATNEAGGSWNYVGPDGTSGTYFTAGTSTIHSSHNGDRYARYKIFLTTASSSYTPTVSDVAFTFTSDCVPPGQVSFRGLDADTFDLTVSKTGYATYVASTTVSSNWQSVVVTLFP